jgi:hypothetical protein
MINNVKDLIAAINDDLAQWDDGMKPWFRGESNDQSPLCPKIAEYDEKEENYLLQSFRRKSAGLANVPPRQGHTDLWLFLAQHYGVPTRLLDWTEGLLHALYFAINRAKSKPKIYMLNAHKLNELAGMSSDQLNYPLSWVMRGSLYIALAWQHRTLKEDQKKYITDHNIKIDIPIAFPATYQDHRMFAQRSCFTIHGITLEPLQDILSKEMLELSEYLIEYEIDIDEKSSLLRELSILGISASTVFPDLEHLARDLITDVERYHKLGKNEDASINPYLDNKQNEINSDDSSST